MKKLIFKKIKPLASKLGTGPKLSFGKGLGVKVPSIKAK